MTDEKDVALNFTDLSYDCLHQIFSYFSYHEITRFRLVCRHTNNVCNSILNSGAENLRTTLNRVQTKLKSQLPRRESARKGHVASDLLEVVNSVENRVSIIRLAIDRYLANGQLSFFPGKVLDEAFRIIAQIERLSAEQLSGNISQTPFTAMQKVTMLRDLRDLSTMASEHLDDVILPGLNPYNRSRLTLDPIHCSFSVNRTSNPTAVQSPEQNCLHSPSSSSSAEFPQPTNGMTRFYSLLFDQIRNLSTRYNEMKNIQKSTDNKIVTLSNEVAQLKQQLAQESVLSAALGKKVEQSDETIVELRRLLAANSSVEHLCPNSAPNSNRRPKRKSFEGSAKHEEQLPMKRRSTRISHL